jgi:hypothetical protein
MPDLNSARDIRRPSAEDAGRIGAIARATYTKYIARMGREPSPMAANFAAQIVANRVVVIEDSGRHPLDDFRDGNRCTVEIETLLVTGAVRPSGRQKQPLIWIAANRVRRSAKCKEIVR